MGPTATAKPLTKRQREILDFIETVIGEKGYAPTLEEIGAKFGLSSMATVHKHVSNLESKGLIRRQWNHSRSIELVDQRPVASAVELPLYGKVAAGNPIREIAGNDTIEVPASMVGRHTTYVLEVEGDSMIDEGILDGDYVVVEERPQPNNGDTVVASIDGEATVKGFHREADGSIRLQPANPAYEPIIVRGGDFEVKGRVVAVLRRYH